MREVKYFVAWDGRQFHSADQCIEYESLINEVKDNVLNLLRQDHSDSHAIQQVKENVIKARKVFAEICAKSIPLYSKEFVECAEGKRHMSHMYRALSDYSDEWPILWKTFFRFFCTSDTNYIEYPQPYYSSHEYEWKGKVI